MRLLTRHILRQIAVPLLLALVVISFIAVAKEIQERVGELTVVELGQVGLPDLARLALYIMPTLIALVIPITFLMGILLAFARLSQQGEIVAMKAAGVSMKRIVVPVIAAGAALSIVCFLLQDRVQPWALARLNKLVYTELPLRATLDVLPAGTMHTYKDWRVYIGAKDKATNTLHDVDIVQGGSENDARVFHAKSARIISEDGRAKIVLQDGHVMPIAQENASIAAFSRRSLTLPELDPKKERSARKVLPIAGLYAHQKERAEEFAKTGSREAREELRKTRYEIGERLLFSFGCLAVGFLAAPLGVRARRQGRSFTFAVGFMIVLVYYILYSVVEPQGLHPLPYVLARAQIPNLVLILAGMACLWRVDRI